MQTGWRLSKLLDALGSKQDKELEVVPSVQPVLIVGEARGLTAPLRGNRVQAGGFIFPGAGEHACVKVQAVSPGGAIVKYVEVSTTVGTTLRWATYPTEPFPSMTTPALNLPMQDEPAQSLIFAGNGLAAELPGLSQTFILIASNNKALPVPPFEIDLPNSWWLVVFGVTANVATSYQAIIEDVEVQTAAL